MAPEVNGNGMTVAVDAVFGGQPVANDYAFGLELNLITGIIAMMRRYIFILMIALLPLRGWMGEAMATEMATMHLIAAQAINTPADATFSSNKGDSSSISSMSASAMPADCEMHAKAVSDASKASDASASTQTCSDCQSCHAAGLVCAVHIISAITTHNPAPAAHVSLYASAKLALSQKPPILQSSSPNSVYTLTFISGVNEVLGLVIFGWLCHVQTSKFHGERV